MWLKDFPCRNFLIRELEEQIANFPVYRRRNEAADHMTLMGSNARRERGCLNPLHHHWAGNPGL
jgi:hypothetical protein